MSGASRRTSTHFQGRSKEVRDWALSFKFVRDMPNCIWPRDSHYVTKWICEFTKSDWKDLLNHAYGPEGKPILKARDAANLEEFAAKDLAVLRDQLGPEALPDDVIYQFTYCARRSEPRRLWGLLYEQVFYVLWWDPEHRVCGYNDRAERAGGLCPKECTHEDKVV